MNGKGRYPGGGEWHYDSVLIPRDTRQTIPKTAAQVVYDRGNFEKKEPNMDYYGRESDPKADDLNDKLVDRVLEATLLHRTLPKMDSTIPRQLATLSHMPLSPKPPLTAQNRMTRAWAEEGYKFGDFTKKAMDKAKEAVTEAGRKATGDPNYQVGDMTKGAAKKASEALTDIGKEVTGDENYKPGDITKAAANAAAAAAEVVGAAASEKAVVDGAKLKAAADVAGKVIMEDENYEFGDVTKGVLKGAKDLADKAKQKYEEHKDQEPKG